MKKKNHFIWTLGLSFWIFYYLNYDIYLIFILGFLTAFLAPIPDIDIKIINFFRKLSKKTYFILYPIYLFVKLIFKHRTITHTIWFSGIFFMIAYYFVTNHYLDLILICIGFAIFLHIFEDSLTKSGVEPFFPVPIKIRLFDFSTSSQIDFIFLEWFGILIALSFPVFFFYGILY